MTDTARTRSVMAGLGDSTNLWRVFGNGTFPRPTTSRRGMATVMIETGTSRFDFSDGNTLGDRAAIDFQGT